MTPRTATPHDAPRIHALLVVAEQNWTREGVVAELARPTGLHLIVDGIPGSGTGPNGVILGWLIHDVAEITMVAVEPAARRQGIGRLLLDAWHGVAKGAGAQKVWLEVRSGNLPARALYERSHYRTTGTRSRYYHDGEDALLMERTLMGPEPQALLDVHP